MKARHAPTSRRRLRGQLALFIVLASPGVAQESPASPVRRAGRFAAQVVRAGDVDGDGRGDLIVRASSMWGGSSLIVSAFDGRLIREADELDSPHSPSVWYAGDGAAGPACVTLRHDARKDRLLLELWSLRDGGALGTCDVGPCRSQRFWDAVLSVTTHEGGAELACVVTWSKRGNRADGVFLRLAANDLRVLRRRGISDHGLVPGHVSRLEAIVDASGDGVRDLTYVATPREPGLPGEVRTICGMCGALLSAHPNAPAGTSLPVGDRNADGVPDVLGVEAFCLGNTLGPVSVVLRSGRTGEELSRIPVPGAGQFMPPQFLPLGDIDGDDAPEIVVTFPTNAWPGDTALALLDGASSRVLWNAPSEERGKILTPYLGRTVAVVDDVDGDGVPDVAVAGDNPWAALDGAVQVHSGRTGALISRITRASAGR